MNERSGGSIQTVREAGKQRLGEERKLLPYMKLLHDVTQNSHERAYELKVQVLLYVALENI